MRRRLDSWVLVALLALALALSACGTGSETGAGDEGPGADVIADQQAPDGLGGDVQGKDAKADTEKPDDVPPVDTTGWDCDSDDNCDDGDECTSDWCTGLHACAHDPRAGWCHFEGGCAPAGEVNPENPCESCQPLARADGYSADDTLACGAADDCATHACKAGLCVAQPTLDCDDQNPCTDDGCEPSAGCVHQNNQRACDDGNVCTLGDVCTSGACVAGTKALGCDDGNLCTNDECNPTTGCGHFLNTAACDDSNPCTQNDRCQDGACTGVPAVDCDDQNPCTDDWCDAAAGCLHKDNSAACDDGDPCSVGDRCIGTVCVSGGDPLPCDDGDPCTDDACVPGSGCQFVANAAPCDDGNLCTENDTCHERQCLGTDVECDDGNPCTEDSCSPIEGCRTADMTGPACDDGLVCTTYDQCDQGLCKGQAYPCDDHNDCTIDSCREPDGCFAEIASELPGCGLVAAVEWPPRGVTLDPSSLTEGLIVVTGAVESPADTAPVVTLNGQAVALTAVAPNDPPREGEVNPGQAKHFTFAVPMTPEQAMNLLELKATDSFGREAGRVQSFYFSSVYYPTEAGTFDGQKVANGMGIALTQEFLDDDNPDLDDLASIIGLVFGGLDIMSLLTNPVTKIDQLGCRYDVNLTSATFSGVDTDLRIVANGLSLGISINNLNIHFRLQRTGGGFWCPGSQNGQATASSAVITTAIAISIVNDALTATVGSSNAKLNGLNVSVDSWFLDLIVGLFQGTIQSALEDAVVGAITDEVAPLLGDVLAMLNLSMPFEIPALMPGMDPTTVTLQTKASSVAFVPDTSMTVGMDGAALGEHKTPYHPLGSLGYANCLASPFTTNTIDFGALSPLDIGLFDDVVNQLLHAVYAAGVFEMVLGPDAIPADQLAQYGVSNLSVALSGMLPPVITACKTTPSGEGVPGSLVLELGDLGIDASFTMNGGDVALTLFASLRGAASLGVTTDPTTGATKVGIQVLGFDTVKTDLVDVQSDDPTMKVLVASLIDSTLMPLLLSQLDFGDALSFELPVLDLSGLSDMVPAGTALEIVPQAVERTANANTLVKASVTQATP